MIIDGRSFQSDLMIIADSVVPGWWRNSGHRVDVKDVFDILKVRPDILVIGKGMPGRMEPTEALRAELQKAKIKLVEQPTPQAAQTFNQLKAEGKKVAAAFHLTC
jgi:hypothetical protein